MDKETRLAKARFAAELKLKKEMHKGDQGYTPVKGKDYFTPREVEELRQTILALIPKPKDGVDAVVDYEKILRYTYAKVAEHVAKIPTQKGLKGDKGDAGKNAVVDIEALVQKVILALPKQKDKKLVIDRDQILELIEERIKKIPAQQPVRIGGSVASIRALTDVNIDGLAQDAQGNFILGGNVATSINGLLTAGPNVTITGAGTAADPFVISTSGGSGGSGDMTKAVYDPNSVEGDAFDMANMAEAADAKVMTATERTNIANSVTHAANTSNPHSVTKTQVGLGNVDNTSDADKPVSTATQNALDAKQSTSEKGSANGYAELDASGKVPSAQLPAFVDDVLEYADFASLPATGASGVLYVTLDTNLVYRWSGSAYVEISASLALGETSTTAYRGDRGKIAYDYSQIGHVALTGAQTVAGVKTFSSSPIVPTPTTDFQAATKKYVDDNAGGNNAYLHTQGSSSDTWTINHNLDDTTPSVVVVVGGEIVEPESIVITNGNTVVVNFGSAVAGTAKVLASGGAVVAGESYSPKLYVYLPDYKPQTEIDTFITNEVDVNGKFWGVFWENFRFNSDGTTLFVNGTVAGGSNLGFTSDNKTRVQNIADNLICGVSGTVSGSDGASAMLADSTLITNAVTAIATHVDSEGFAGVNINFEPISDLSGTKLTNFKLFIAELKTALEADNPNAILTWAGQIAWDSDQPNKEYSAVNYTGESNMAGTNLLSFTLNDLEDMGFNLIEMQAYDQFYDFGAQEFGITSPDQVSNAIGFAHSRIPKSKYGLIIGSYGVMMNDGTDVYGGGLTGNNMTRAEVTGVDATFYSTATRDVNRYLRKSVTGSKQILAPDQSTIDTYYNICKNKEVEYIGFWLAGDYYYPSER